MWPQELPGNHTQCNKTNVEIQNTVPGMPVEATYRHYPLQCWIDEIYRFWHKMPRLPKGCAHIASTESTERPEPRNQGGMIGHPIRKIWVNIHLHKINQYQNI